MKFRSKSVIVLRRETKTSRFWTMLRGNKRSLFAGLYIGWQKAYGTIEDRDRIVRIRIEITREK